MSTIAIDKARAGMGAIVHESGIAFRVWAPHADAVSVVGSFNDWHAETPCGKARPDYGRKEVRQFSHDNALMWLEEYHVDGLRLDMTLFMRNVRGDSDPGGDLPDGLSLVQWINREVRQALSGTHHHRRGPPERRPDDEARGPGRRRFYGPMGALRSPGAGYRHHAQRRISVVGRCSRGDRGAFQRRPVPTRYLQ